MGGIGSGRRRGAEFGRVGDLPSLRVNDLRKAGLFEAEEWKPLHVVSSGWCRGRGVSNIRFLQVHRERNGVRAGICFIPLEAVPQNFGGVRHWFKCPGCSRRAGVVYFAGQRIGCRVCLELRHESQLERPVMRAKRRMFELRRRLRWSLDPFGEPGRKPKGMHWKTFERLEAEAIAAQDVYFLLLTAEVHGVRVSMAKLAARFGVPPKWRW